MKHRIAPPASHSLLAIAFAASVAVGCGSESGAGAADDVAIDIPSIDDTGLDTRPLDTGTSEDTGSPDVADGSGEPVGGCNETADCEAGEVCVDLLTGPDNGICTTRCLDDTQCPEGFDCVVIGDDEGAIQVCIDPEFCFDADGDGYGEGPGCLGMDCDETTDRINAGAPEVCNLTDDNCDGLVDNNTVETGEDCDTGELGVCAEGRTVCESGVTRCEPRRAPSDEICDTRDNDCDGEVDEEATDALEWFRDIDGDRYGDDEDVLRACSRPDGYTSDGGDCDDRDRAFNPGATEICDGVDNDCDGTIDGDDAVGTGLFYIDGDNDGFGNPDVSRFGCPEVGWVDNGRDCNDGDIAINPEAPEICDDIDNNCNEQVDEGGGEGAELWYLDSDLDGYGDPEDFVRSCNPVEGRVRNRNDCDDSDRDINPEATEVCDGVDNDCNDLIDDGVSTIYYRDADADTYGDADNTIAACALPGGYVTNSTDCDDSTNLRFPGNPEVCDGIDNNCDGAIDNGAGSTWYIDNDKDGYGDTAIVACTRPPNTVTQGGDCNDNNLAVNPDADELCSTPYDDDCDDAINESSAIDARWWFWDEDGDGQGIETPALVRFPPIAVRACTKPADFCIIPIVCLFDPDLQISYVDNDNDCDDSTTRACTGCGPETCDGYDNECNGTRDNGFDRNLTFCRDRDGDGNGDPSYRITVCAYPVDADDGDWVVPCTDTDDGD
jgi:hypothetical protein